MTAASVSERVLAAIRLGLAARAYSPGQRLDPATLASELSSSVTPVRDALHVLRGEGLVTSATGEGFHVPGIDEPALRDLFVWNLEVLSLAVRSCVATASSPGEGSADPGEWSPTAVGAVFAAIGHRSDNAEHEAAISRNNARLGPFRSLEPLIFPDVADEFAAIVASTIEGSLPALRHRLTAYHRSRERKAGAIVRAHYRAAVVRSSGCSV